VFHIIGALKADLSVVMPNKCIHRIVKIVALFAVQKVTPIFPTADARR